MVPDVWYNAMKNRSDPEKQPGHQINGNLARPTADVLKGRYIQRFRTMYRWAASARGHAATLHPFAHGRYPGSGPGPAVVAEAELDGASQYRRLAATTEAFTAGR